MFGSGYSIFLMRQFIMQIPVEYDEATRLDGLGYVGIWRRSITPLSVPMVMVYFFGQRFLYEGANTLGQIRV